MRYPLPLAVRGFEEGNEQLAFNHVCSCTVSPFSTSMGQLMAVWGPAGFATQTRARGACPALPPLLSPRRPGTVATSRGQTREDQSLAGSPSPPHRCRGALQMVVCA